MPKCFYCGVELDKTNRSLEHIIPNGIAGKLSSYNLLCAKHNNKFSKIDNDLCVNLTLFTNTLNPKRERENNPKCKMKLSNGLVINRLATGEYYADDIISVIPTKHGAFIKFKTCYSGDDKFKQVKKDKYLNICKNILLKQNAPIEIINKKLEEYSSIFESSIQNELNPEINFNISFNAKNNLFPATLKIAIEFYLYNNLPQKHINNAIEILKSFDEQAILNICAYCYPENFYKTDSVYHTIYLKADSNKRVLYCCMSFYGVLNTIVLLNDNYNGEDIEYSYCYDLRNDTEIEFNNKLDFDIKMIEHFLDRNYSFNQKIVECCNVFMQFLVKREYKFDYLYTQIKSVYNSILLGKFISNEENYANTFYLQITNMIKSDNELKYIQNRFIKQISDACLELYTYEQYLKDYKLDRIGHIFSKILAISIAENPHILTNIDLLADKCCTTLNKVNTNDLCINEYLATNKEIICNNLREFITSNNSFLQKINYYKELFLLK